LFLKRSLFWFFYCTKANNLIWWKKFVFDYFLLRKGENWFDEKKFFYLLSFDCAKEKIDLMKKVCFWLFFTAQRQNLIWWVGFVFNVLEKRYLENDDYDNISFDMFRTRPLLKYLLLN
jgi:hypothetical protein